MKEERRLNVVQLITLAVTAALLVAALLLASCGGGIASPQDASRERLEQLDRQLMIGMQADGDSVLRVIDSLESARQLPAPLGDYERATCYALMEQRRIGEYYYKKALEGDALYRLWPDAFFRASTNLAILLSGKNDEQGALSVATSAYERIRERPGDAAARWAPALLFNIGSSQLRLGRRAEGLRTLEQSLTQMEATAGRERTSENLRTLATLAVNAATVVAESADDAAVPWIARADEAVRQLPFSREIPGQLIDMLTGKVASLMAIYCIGHGRPGDAEQAYRKYLSTDFSQYPTSQIERLTYLEQAGRWEEAARLLPSLMELQRSLGLAYTMDYLRLLAEAFTVYHRAGLPVQATASAVELAGVVDSVKRHQQMDAAAELAVIYETQQKEDEIRHQQWQMRRQQGAAVALLLVLVIVFLTIYLIQRRKALQRLKAANDQLAERNAELTVANARAEESSLMKSQFIRQISHEIRTPLNILSGFTQVVTSPEADMLDEDDRRDISRRITENTDRITSLVNKMLELSEASSQTVIGRDDVVTAAEIAAQGADLSGIRRSRHVAFSLTMDEGAEQVRLLTNGRYAVRALSLLLDNAEKFTHGPTDRDNLPDAPGEKAEVRLRVELGGERLVRFVVEDTGCGVPPEEADHIFDEFVQLNEFYEGTGVGLTVARSIARRLGGDIRLDTSYTGGARFVMELPKEEK